MFNRIVVALDGSHLSERALLYGRAFAAAVQAKELILLKVVADGSGETLQEGEAYLRSLPKHSSRTEDRGSIHIRHVAIRGQTGGAAANILRFVEDNGVGAAVMATHGHTGFRRLVLGSVAEAVLRRSLVPTLLVPAHGDAVDGWSVRSMVVTLDGSKLAERVLSVVALLGRVDGVTVRLVRVGPGAHPKVDEIEEYLNTIAEQLTQAGVRCETEPHIGNPTQEVLASVGDADLVVMSTHGHSGVVRLTLGSITESVLHELETPALIARRHPGLAEANAAEAPSAHRCFHCGRPIFHEQFRPHDRCGRCHYLSQQCRNCVNLRDGN